MTTPKSQFILFSQTTKTSLFVSLAPFFVFRGPNLSAVNYQSPGKKNIRKNKAYFILQTLCYGHYIMDTMLRK